MDENSSGALSSDELTAGLRHQVTHRHMLCPFVVHRRSNSLLVKEVLCFDFVALIWAVNCPVCGMMTKAEAGKRNYQMNLSSEG